MTGINSIRITTAVHYCSPGHNILIKLIFSPCHLMSFIEDDHHQSVYDILFWQLFLTIFPHSTCLFFSLVLLFSIFSWVVCVLFTLPLSVPIKWSSLLFFLFFLFFEYPLSLKSLMELLVGYYGAICVRVFWFQGIKGYKPRWKEEASHLMTMASRWMYGWNLHGHG